MITVSKTTGKYTGFFRQVETIGEIQSFLQLFLQDNVRQDQGKKRNIVKSFYENRTVYCWYTGLPVKKKSKEYHWNRCSLEHLIPQRVSSYGIPYNIVLCGELINNIVGHAPLKIKFAIRKSFIEEPEYEKDKIKLRALQISHSFKNFSPNDTIQRILEKDDTDLYLPEELEYYHRFMNNNFTIR